MKSAAIRAKERAKKVRDAERAEQVKANQALIRKYRNMGWSTEAIAIRLGVTEVTVRNYERKDQYAHY